MITIDLVTEQTNPIFLRMFMMYFHDLSEFDPNIHINQLGFPIFVGPGQEFDLSSVTSEEECLRANWWIRAECEQRLIHCDGIPAGFVILNRTGKFIAPGYDTELVDFYVLPKFRRQGVGSKAARLAFDLYPGFWQVYQLEKNTKAIKFWHKVIGEATNDQFEILDDGAQQRFCYPPR